MNTLRLLTSEEIRGTCPRLYEIPHPPRQLYVKGILPDHSFPHLCIVGSRKATAYGEDVCSYLIQQLGSLTAHTQRPIVIVSGLAYGIDALAHTSALRAGLPTIAFPGSGLDDNVLYPKAHHYLARDIVEYSKKIPSALISEFHLTQKATQWTFPKRNRLMAGISHAVLIIEAELGSGTLITARMALDYNRDVYTVPGSIFSPTSAGPHHLIQHGATPIQNAYDILQALGYDFQTHPQESPSGNLTLYEPPSLSFVEKIVWNYLSEPLTVQTIIDTIYKEPRNQTISVADILSALSLLTVNGIVIEKNGMYRRHLQFSPHSGNNE